MLLLGRQALACTMLCMLALACVSGPAPKDIRAAEIQYDLGVNDLRSGRLLESLKEFMEAVRLNPQLAQGYNALGLVHYLLNDFPKSLENLDRALQLKPDYSEVLNTKARVLISQGKFHEAIPLLQEALEDVFLPERFLAESNLGWAQFQVGQTEEGIRRVKNALAQNEKFCVGFEYLGLMFQASKNLEEAVVNFRKLLERCPEYPQGLLLLGKALLMSGQELDGCQQLQTCRTQGGMSLTGQECDRLFRLSCKTPPPSSPSPPPPPPSPDGQG